VNTTSQRIFRMLTYVGNALTVLGCAGLLLGVTGVVTLEYFAIGISSGVRVIGSVAIAGCLLSAMGYAAIEYSDH